MHDWDKGDVRYIASLKGQYDLGAEVTVEMGTEAPYLKESGRFLNPAGRGFSMNLGHSSTMSDYGYPYVRHRTCDGLYPCEPYQNRGLIRAEGPGLGYAGPLDH